MKLVKILLIAVVIVGLLSLAVWYFTILNPDALTNVMVWEADRAEDRGDYDQAIRLYSWATALEDTNPSLALDLASAYEASGNYTKTEYTLVTAIRDMPDETELYTRLCQVYVAQDKLLDAVQMLSAVSNASVRDELMALRPAAPVIGPEGGYYTSLIDVTVTGEGTLYVSTTEEYPSTETPYTAPLSLAEGDTTITALAVDPETGLVSPLSAAVYTVGSVVREVTLTDPVLEACLRELLGKSDGETFWSDELWTITSLTLPEGTVSLSDLVLLTGLESLTIQNLSVPDLSPLARLKQLKTLSITGCSVSEEGLAVLGTMTSLTDLTLTGCGLTTLSPLSALSSLTRLNVSDNAIGSLAPLAELSSLTWLDVSHNALTDLSPLSSLRLLQNLNVSGNPLEDLAGLPETLTILNVSGCDLKDLEALASLTRLDTLTASDNAIANLDPLAACEELRVLEVSGNGLTSLDCTADLPNLETLRASNNALTDLPDYPEDCVLTTLEVSYNELTSLEGLRGLARLNYLDIDYNQVTDLSPLYACWTLVQLTAYGCPVSVTQATRLTEAGVIVRYSPDYTAEDLFADEETETVYEREADTQPTEVVIVQVPEADMDQAAEPEQETVPEATESDQPATETPNPGTTT